MTKNKITNSKKIATWQQNESLRSYRYKEKQSLALEKKLIKSTLVLCTHESKKFCDKVLAHSNTNVMTLLDHWHALSVDHYEIDCSWQLKTNENLSLNTSVDFFLLWRSCRRDQSLTMMSCLRNQQSVVIIDQDKRSYKLQAPTAHKEAKRPFVLKVTLSWTTIKRSICMFTARSFIFLGCLLLKEEFLTIWWYTMATFCLLL